MRLSRAYGHHRGGSRTQDPLLWCQNEEPLSVSGSHFGELQLSLYYMDGTIYYYIGRPWLPPTQTSGLMEAIGERLSLMRPEPQGCKVLLLLA